VRWRAGPLAAGGARGCRSTKLIKVYTWFAHWCAGARKGFLTVHIQFANNGEKFTLLTKKVCIRGYETAKQNLHWCKNKFALLQKEFTFLQQKFAKSLQKVCIIYQKLTKKVY
jgi:hypothetical protein